jgi:hypothetical protein
MRVQTLLTELGISHSKKASLWCDNLGSTYLSSNPDFHVKTKHIEVDDHFVQERVVNKQLDIRLYLIPTGDQVADGFTKPLFLRHLEGFCRNLILDKVVPKGACKTM